jgi:hypothetical protein
LREGLTLTTAAADDRWQQADADLELPVALLLQCYQQGQQLRLLPLLLDHHVQPPVNTAEAA